MKKSELRKLYLAKKETLSKEQVQDFSKSIFENFIKNFNPQPNQNVHIFQSIEKFNEVETKTFIHYFFEKNIRVFVPKMFGGKVISIEITPETQLIKNSWGISEPETNEDSGEKDFNFIITPLLYCDKFGNRIGYGKGCYDKFFAEINKNSKKIGVSFFPPNESIDDISEFDVALDYLVLPTEVLSFLDLTSKSTK